MSATPSSASRRGRSARSTARSRGPAAARRSAARARPGAPRPARRRGPCSGRAVGRLAVTATAPVRPRPAARRRALGDRVRRGVERAPPLRRRRRPRSPTPAAGRTPGRPPGVRPPLRPAGRRRRPPLQRPRPGSRATSHEHGDREAGDALAAARARRGPPARRPLTVTGRTDGRARPGLHLVAHGRQSGLLADHRAVGVADRPARRRATSSATWRSSSIESAPANARVGVGEVLADVAEAGRAEQRLGDGVGDGVAVAVPDEPGHAREPAAAEHQRPVRIVARRGGRRSPGRPGPPGSPCAAGRRPSQRVAPARGRRASVILRFHGSPGDRHDAPAGRLDERGVVGALAAAGVGPAQHAGAERLRGLHGDERRPVGRRHDACRRRRRP